MEVVTAYYTEEEAKATAEVAAEKLVAADEVREGELIGSPDDSICNAIKECLDEKCKKAYSGAEQTWWCSLEHTGDCMEWNWRTSFPPILFLTLAILFD